MFQPLVLHLPWGGSDPGNIGPAAEKSYRELTEAVWKAGKSWLGVKLPQKNKANLILHWLYLHDISTPTRPLQLAPSGGGWALATSASSARPFRFSIYAIKAGCLYWPRGASCSVARKTWAAHCWWPVSGIWYFLKHRTNIHSGLQILVLSCGYFDVVRF